MRSPLYLQLAAACLLLAGQTLCGEGETEPEHAVTASDEVQDVSFDEDDDYDVPEALDDEVCDKLWSKALEQEDRMLSDGLIQWENLCAMKHGLCELEEPYWTMGLRHSYISFSYKHEVMMIKSRVSNSMTERCQNPEVKWEKIGEKYRVKQQVKAFRRYHADYAKKGKKGKKIHRRREKKPSP